MSKYFFLGPGRIKKIIKNRFIYLFLDYDGTLAPIVSTPGKAIMPQKTKKALRRLSGISCCKVAVITGRSLSDIQKKIGLKGNIVYVGNHGFEIKGPKINFKSPVPAGYRSTLDEIKQKLQKALSGIKGILIEDKGFSLSLHYRLAGEKDIQKIKTEFYATLVPYEVRNGAKVKTGKKVFEIRPPMDWDKGKVVLWLLARQKFLLGKKKKDILPIYIGDDVTDEDAFGALKGRGLTIRVGKLKNSRARYYLENTDEASGFLDILSIDLGRNATCRKMI